MNITNKDFIILDIETTGFSHEENEITEIGAIKVNGNTLEKIKTFSSFINIKGQVPWFITNLNKIDKQVLDQQGIKLDIVLKKLVSFCGDLDIYAHNASFDKRFIRCALAQESINYFETNWIDTIKIFKLKLPKQKTYKLESLIQNFNLATKIEHRAVSDATYTLELLKLTL